MKFLGAIILSTLLSASAWGMAGADGKIFYKKSSGELVKRAVSIVVPPRGEGEVVLKFGDKELSTPYFKTKTYHGRTVFVVAFKKPEAFSEDLAGNGALVMKGSYMRGSNMAVYYGDLYLVKKASQELMEYGLEFDSHGETTFSHLGGFAFKKVID